MRKVSGEYSPKYSLMVMKFFNDLPKIGLHGGEMREIGSLGRGNPEPQVLRCSRLSLINHYMFNTYADWPSWTLEDTSVLSFQQIVI